MTVTEQVLITLRDNQSDASHTDVSQTSATTPVRMSAEDFLRMEHHGIAEWINGEVIFMSVKYEHQRIVDFLNALLRLFTQMMNLGVICTVPYPMRARPGANLREPDLVFVSADHAHRLTSQALEGPADLIIEVVSDGSVIQDYDDKYVEYRNAGVREYWIIDPRPDRLRTSFHVLDSNQQFRVVALDDEGIYHATVLPGFWFNTNRLWQDPQPRVDELLLEIGGDAYLQQLISKRMLKRDIS